MDYKAGMCIIIGPVRGVKETKIFVMPSGDRQLTVYRNTVGSDSENLMVLPVPYPETIRFEKKKYKKIFQDLSKSVRWFRYSFEEIGLTAMRSCVNELPVFEVGSYRVSVVPSVNDFFRLSNELSVSQELETLLRDAYSHGPFGFVCCRLKAGAQNYEPLSYTHKLLREGILFVPTKHYHHGQDNRVGDWDHEIYSLRTTKEANHCNGIPLPENFLDSKKLPEGFEVHRMEPVHCFMKSGIWDNVDIEFQIVP